ncbi:MAG: Male sterility domain protein [Tardiphaga sp.]|uniref:SDR family oxidoreductase n=1 Tax=Tardiphaga sp. TaxID=1926292 RepID=UPI00260E54AC|nr:SDR family oxidoreductase [Tardiphaga sp.]MDB5502868.1 Male sterility domain protein [Tardiphaga sp.]
MTAIFVTGATGVVGQALIARLPWAQLYCLVRRTPVSGRNIQPIAGDISLPRLGLTRSEYVELAGRINLVVHAAAITDFEQPQDTINQTNVEGTQNIIELACTASVPLYYIGTAFSETRTSIGGFDANSYEISKRAAEQVVRSSGVPHVILRPSVVVGDSRTGAISRFQGFHLVMGLLLRGLLPMAPAAPSSYIDFVPQDLVARIIAGLIERGDTHGEHWLTLGDSAITLQQLVEWCLEHATRLTGRTVARPRAFSPDAFERLIRPVFLPALPPHLRQLFDRALHMARYFNIDQAFPSSVPRLCAELNIEKLPQPQPTLARNIEYWARRNDFGGEVAQALPA